MGAVLALRGPRASHKVPWLDAVVGILVLTGIQASFRERNLKMAQELGR
jgi:hypothetical protein